MACSGLMDGMEPVRTISVSWGVVKATYSGTRSGEGIEVSLARKPVTWSKIRVHTWTSFSPSATFLTMSRRAALSGLGFLRYSALRMSSSSLLWEGNASAWVQYLERWSAWSLVAG